MKVAKVTVMAINHGLMPALKAGMATVDLGALLAARDALAVRVSLTAFLAQLDAKETVRSHK